MYLFTSLFPVENILWQHLTTYNYTMTVQMCEKTNNETWVCFFFFLRQWSSVNIKRSSYQKNLFSLPCILKHITAPTKTNGSINNIDIIHSDSKFKERKKWKFIEDTVCSNEWSIFFMFTLCFQFGCHISFLFYHTYWDESCENLFFILFYNLLFCIRQ